MDKQAFQAHAGHNVQITRADGTELRLDDGDVHETADADDIRELQAHPFVKAAEKKSGGKD